MKIGLSCLFLLFLNCVIAQKDSSFWKDHTDFNGYVKYMETFSGDQQGEVYAQSLIHNRLNSKLYFNDHHTISLEIRNRVFYGEGIKIQPFFKEALDTDLGLVDMSFVAGEPESFLFSSVIDRLYYSGHAGNWEWGIGRQRINWGITSFWNSNDLFNAFNFTDFDYEERPGSDGFRIQRYFDKNWDLEVAGSFAGDSLSVVAGKLAWNVWNYDFQLIGGKYLNYSTLGGGWAGNIGNWSFKGEVSGFQLLRGEKTIQTSVSIGGEYLLERGDFIGLGVLYTSTGLRNLDILDPSFLAYKTSALRLMPSAWSLMGVYGGELNDYSTYNIVCVYAPELNFALLMPSVNTSIAEDWEISFFAINVLGYFNKDLFNVFTGFARLKYSF